MTISDSIPIQFWVNGQETYNEKQICGVYKACFCQPWLCDKEIVLQVTDTIEGQELTLKIYNENDVEILTIPFVASEIIGDITIYPPLQFSNTDFPGNITGWQSFLGDLGATAADWVYFGGNAFATTASNYRTRYFATQREDNPSLGWPPGNYTVTVTAQNTGEDDCDIIAWGMTDSSTPVSITFSSSGDFANTGESITRTVDFTLSTYTPYIAFSFNNSPGFDITVAIEEIEITSAPIYDTVYTETIYDLSFIPSEVSPEICNQKVRFEIVGDEDTGRSDCIDIRSSHDCLTEIIYANTNNFDGINYESGSPTPVFTALIPAQFWKEDNPQEQEDSVLSNGVIVTRRTEIQEKTLLEVGFVPNYFHKKIQKILMHNSVQIEDVNGDLTFWKKRDGYESENLNRYPLKTGQVWLTKYNSVEKNTI